MKTKVKYLILGAGPSGLSFAHTLLASGEDSFLVLEREAEAGGLCRSQDVDGAPLDIGGGHFLDVKKKDVLDLVFRHMPREEWNLHDRVSKITIRGTEVDHPLEANLWQLPVEAQIDFLESIAQAGCVRGQPMPESFQDWITWKLGDRIAGEYMLPYNRKIWSMDLNQLGTYWLYKLPDVSFRETLQSCLERRATGKLPAHGQFFYPKKFGYGEVWRRMGLALGDRFVPNCPVTQIDIESLTVNGQFQGEKIVSSIPWTLWPKMAKVPAEITTEIGKLVNVPIDVDYDPTMQNTPSHWVYDPDEALTHHRRLVRHNFCPGSKGFWTETNANRSGPVKHFRHHNEFAYPVNTLGKPEAVEAIGKWALGRGIHPLGRWGIWEHMNSDVATQLGIEAAKKVMASR